MGHLPADYSNFPTSRSTLRFRVTASGQRILQQRTLLPRYRDGLPDGVTVVWADVPTDDTAQAYEEL